MGAGSGGGAAATAAAAAAAAEGGEVVEFGWGDDGGTGGSGKPLTGRRRKAAQEQKKKNRAGTFDSMGLAPWLLRNVRRKGFRLPTPIQRRAIPLVLAGGDVIAMARTGSGKTAAFVLPLLHKLGAHAAKAGARGLILSPTRELALQTHKVVRELARDSGLRCAVLVGGDAMEAQFAELAQNPDVIVATPGRLLHHLAEVAGFSLSGVTLVVFDEADRMFEMGLAEQVREIVSQLREGRQSLMFSATLPTSLAEFAAAGLSNPQLVRLDAERRLSPDLGTAFFTVRADDKPAALLWLLRDALPHNSPTLVFVATRHHVEFLAGLLGSQGVTVGCVYGAMDQTARKIHVAKFRAGKVSVLLTTDVAARGIDIPLIDNVVNYDFPAKPELFVHRCGRAARAGRPGSALSLLTRDELPYLLDLALFLGRAAAPAGLTPARAQVEAAAAAMDAAGGLVAAAAAATAAAGSGLGGGGNASSEQQPGALYGSFPGLLLEPLVERLRSEVESQPELAGMGRSLGNAYGLYLKTRPAASSESVRRARQLAPEGAHPLLLAAVSRGAGGRLNMQEEASLAEFTAKLRAFRPAATVLEAEIAKVRPSHQGPTMQTEAEAGVIFRSNDVMSRKRASHSAIIERERSKRAAAAAAAAEAAGGGQEDSEGDDDEQQQQQARKRRKGPDGRAAAAAAADGHDDDDSGSGSSGGDADMQQDADDGISSGDDDGDDSDFEQQQQQQQQAAAVSKKRRRATFALPPAPDAPLASGRFRDDAFFISHTREGRTHSETFNIDSQAAQLQSAVLDLTGEDQGAMTQQQRQYRWDKKKKAYVNTAGADESRRGGGGSGGIKPRKVRNEAGQLVLAGPRKGGQDGDLYKKWAKHNKAAVAATGTPEDAAPDPDLARRFDKGMRHRSFKATRQQRVGGGGGWRGGGKRGGGSSSGADDGGGGGLNRKQRRSGGAGGAGGGASGAGAGGGGSFGPARRGGELKTKDQILKERRKKAKLQDGMKARAAANAARRERGGGGGGGRKGGRR